MQAGTVGTQGRGKQEAEVRPAEKLLGTRSPLHSRVLQGWGGHRRAQPQAASYCGDGTRLAQERLEERHAEHLKTVWGRAVT